MFTLILEGLIHDGCETDVLSAPEKTRISGHLSDRTTCTECGCVYTQQSATQNCWLSCSTTETPSYAFLSGNESVEDQQLISAVDMNEDRSVLTTTTIIMNEDRSVLTTTAISCTSYRKNNNIQTL